MNDDEVLDYITEKLSCEAWFEGRTLTIMVDDDGTTRFAKLRLVKVSDKPSAAEFRGEPS